MDNEKFDQFVMWLSTEFFFDSCHLLSQSISSRGELDAAQKVARASVDSFLPDDGSYWESDFSDDRIKATKRRFMAELQCLPDRTVQDIGRIHNAFISTNQEDLAIAVACSAIYQCIANDDFMTESNFRSATVHAIRRDVNALHVDGTLGMLERKWLESSREWDFRIRESTPDIPDFVFSSFAVAVTRMRELPQLERILRYNLGPDQRELFRKELEAVLKKDVDDQVVIGNSIHFLIN